MRHPRGVTEEPLAFWLQFELRWAINGESAVLTVDYCNVKEDGLRCRFRVLQPEEEIDLREARMGVALGLASCGMTIWADDYHKHFLVGDRPLEICELATGVYLVVTGPPKEVSLNDRGSLVEKNGDEEVVYYHREYGCVGSALTALA